MKKVLFLWQQVYYNSYKFNCFTQIYVFGLPVTLLFKNKYIISQYKKRRVENPSEILKRTLTNPQTSTVNWLTDGIMVLLIGLIVFSFLNFATAIAGYMIWADWSFLIYLILIGVPSILINYFVLWKDDKYLIYYKEFENQSKLEKKKWAWVSFMTVLLIIALLILSFKIMTDNIHK